MTFGSVLIRSHPLCVCSIQRFPTAVSMAERVRRRRARHCEGGADLPQAAARRDAIGANVPNDGGAQTRMHQGRGSGDIQSRTCRVSLACPRERRAARAKTPEARTVFIDQCPPSSVVFGCSFRTLHGVLVTDGAGSASPRAVFEAQDVIDREGHPIKYGWGARPTGRGSRRKNVTAGCQQRIVDPRLPISPTLGPLARSQAHRRRPRDHAILDHAQPGTLRRGGRARVPRIAGAEGAAGAAGSDGPRVTDLRARGVRGRDLRAAGHDRICGARIRGPNGVRRLLGATPSAPARVLWR